MKFQQNKHCFKVNKINEIFKNKYPEKKINSKKIKLIEKGSMSDQFWLYLKTSTQRCYKCLVQAIRYFK